MVLAQISFCARNDVLVSIANLSIWAKKGII
jgi:hypothetical protein